MVRSVFRKTRSHIILGLLNHQLDGNQIGTNSDHIMRSIYKWPRYIEIYQPVNKINTASLTCLLLFTLNNDTHNSHNNKNVQRTRCVSFCCYSGICTSQHGTDGQSNQHGLLNVSTCCHQVSKQSTT